MATELHVTIPGEPVAQGRPRAFMRPGMKAPRVFDPAKSRSWKGAAQHHYVEAITAAGLTAPFIAEGPVELRVMAIFTCPKSRWRQRSPARRCPKVSTPDAENIAKAVQDAGNGVLWTDDCQVARLVVEKHVGAQGEAPRVEVSVRPLVA